MTKNQKFQLSQIRHHKTLWIGVGRYATHASTLLSLKKGGYIDILKKENGCYLCQYIKG